MKMIKKNSLKMVGEWLMVFVPKRDANRAARKSKRGVNMKGGLNNETG